MKRLLIFLFTVGLYFSANAQLTAGDIMFVGVLYDGDDGFSILALDDIPANTTIYFSDRVWNGSSFDTGSQYSLTWNSGGSLIDGGTVINFENIKGGGPAATVTEGSITSGEIRLNNSGDRIYAFLGTDDVSPTTFLTAFSNEDFVSGGSTLSGTGLTVGVNVTEFTDGASWDVLVYNGSTTCNTTKADCAADIANTANWNTDNDNSNGSPNFPGDVQTSFSGNALPITLMSFFYELGNGSVLIKWETATELDNLGYHLEKSLDGLSFQSLAFIIGSGTSSTRNSYEYRDEETRPVYYRLTQEDFDGTKTIEGLIYVDWVPVDLDLLIYPNPTSGIIVLEGPITSYRLVDAMGQEIVTKYHATTADAAKELSKKLELSGAGVYFLFSSINEKERAVIRIIRE